MNEFFQRLKQRKLVQWAIAYVAAAVALLQASRVRLNVRRVFESLRSYSCSMRPNEKEMSHGKVSWQG
jgi:hypothetical protein